MGERWLDRSEWENAICDDLRPVLECLETRYGARIAKVHLDMKSSITEIYLEGEPPPDAIALLERELGANDALRFWPKGAVSCQRDWTGISWSSALASTPAPAKAATPWWKLW